MKDQQVWRRENAEFLYIREEIMQFCDFDQYPALLLSCLIGWHTHTVNENLRAGHPEEKPWITISKVRLRQSLLGLIGYRKIDDGVEFLCAKLVLSVRQPTEVGGGCSYRLDIPRLNELLRALPPLEEFPGPGEVPARKNGWSAQQSKPAPVGIDAERTLGMDADVVGIDAEPPSALMPSVSINKDLLKDPPEILPAKIADLDLEDNIQTFAPNAYRRLRRPRLKLGRNTDALTVQRLEEQEEKHGAEFYRQCLLGYLAREDQWLRENKWTINRFLQNPESYAPKNQPPAPVDDAQATIATPVAVTEPPSAADAPTPAVARFLYPDRWNELVPAMKVDWDWKRSNVDALRLAELDDVFVARFDEICIRAQKIHTARPGDQKYLTFNWILKRDGRSGPYNWFKVLQDFEWMETPEKQRGVNSEIGTAGPRPWVPGMVCDTAEQLKARRVWQAGRREKGKHTDDDRAAREGDIT